MNGPLVIFGATGGVGSACALQAQERGHAVVAVVRPGSESRLPAVPGLAVRTADAMDPPATRAACASCPDAQAVVCTLGGGAPGASADFAGTRHVIEAAREAGIRRFVLVSSLGAGNSRPFASERLIAAIGPTLEEKTRAENHLKASPLAYTILRPGWLQDGPATGRGALYDDPRVHGKVSRADVARLILDCLASPKSAGRTLAVIDSDTLFGPEDPVLFPL